MRSTVEGELWTVTDEIREGGDSRFSKRVGKQVSDLATLGFGAPLFEGERPPDLGSRWVPKRRLGAPASGPRTPLRAKEAVTRPAPSIHELAEGHRRQVKKHRESGGSDQTTRN